MKTSLLPLLATFLLAPISRAGDVCPSPGSLLLFPYFESGSGSDTILTVTNTADSGAEIKVEFVYRSGSTCLEFNRDHRLKPADTLTVSTSAHNPNIGSGYVFAFAKNVTTGQAFAFDHLVGASRVIQGSTASHFEITPFVFHAAEGLSEGQATDRDGDGRRDLDGAEYQAVPSRLAVPRFLGQSTTVASELVLVNLSQGASHSIPSIKTALTIMNDNSQRFSAVLSFPCWTKSRLTSISGAFNETFLRSTSHNLGESVLNSEAGWIEIQAVASATNPSPAMLGVLLERVSGERDAVPAFAYGHPIPGRL